MLTIADIKEANKRAGGHFFDRAAMKFFGSKIFPSVYRGPDGFYFVTSEQPPHGGRVYKVRRFNPRTADIVTPSGITDSPDVISARKKAQELAKSGSGWFGEPRRHSEAALKGKGSATVPLERKTHGLTRNQQRVRWSKAYSARSRLLRGTWEGKDSFMTEKGVLLSRVERDRRIKALEKTLEKYKDWDTL